MQIGDRKTLDGEREALRDRFDAIWMASDASGPTERRAVRCALALDKPRFHCSTSWRIYPWGGATHNGPIIG